MKSMLLKKYYNNIFDIAFYDSDQLLLLGEFLNDCLSYTNIENAVISLDEINGDISFNMTFAKRIDDLLIVGHDYFQIPDLKLPYKKICPLLHAWKRVYEELPDEVLITMDDEYNFKMFFDGKEVL